MKSVLSQDDISQPLTSAKPFQEIIDMRSTEKMQKNKQDRKHLISLNFPKV